MAVKVLLLLPPLLLLLCALAAAFASDAEDKPGLHRKPVCPDMSLVNACPLNYAPVCGTDGNTYANECALCFQRLETKTEILVARDGPC